MSGVANKTAFSILAALEGQEEVDEAAISDLPEDEEVRRGREARAKEKQKKAKQQQLVQQAAAAKAKQQPPKLVLPFDLIRRTRMCGEWLSSGRCKDGKDCVFAHDVQEMNANRLRVKKYQAEQYAKMGYTAHAAYLANTAAAGLPGGASPSSSAVAAASSAGPSSATAGSGGGSGVGRHPTGVLHPVFQRGGALYKTRLCRNYMRGQCFYGDNCTFAHGEGDLRAHLHDEAALQAELVRWGLRDAPGGSRSGHAGYDDFQHDGTGSSGDYSYIDSLYGAAPAAVAQPAAPQAPQPADVFAKEMDAAHLAQLMQGLDFTEEDDNPAFLCPITHDRLHDPVVAADGYTYERSAIEAWLSTRDTSPMTNQALEDKVLIPNLTLREAMRVVLGDGEL